MKNCCSEYDDSCKSIVYQTVDVGLPVVLTPDVKMGEIKVKCLDEPSVAICKSKGCNYRCELMITQTISYKIPIEYGAHSTMSEAICSCNEGGCQ